jgi:hypothetical protein
MIASLPELSPSWPNAASPLPPVPGAAAEGAALDFGGLLDAASSAPSALVAAPFVPSSQPLLPGKMLPEEGASLPPAMLAVVPADVAAPAPVTVPAAPPQQRTAAPRADLSAARGLSADMPEHRPLPDAVTLDPGTQPDPAGVPADLAAPPEPQAWEPVPEPTQNPAQTPAQTPAPAPASDAVPPSDPAVLAALLAAPAAPPVAVAPPARQHRAGPLSPANHTVAPKPERVTLPAAPAEDAPEVQTASAPPSAPTLLPAAESAALPSSAPVQPAPTLAAPPLALATPAPDRIEAPRIPAPQQEAAIAQVGDLREALRSARPEMTLRHAEFGAVSLRLEQPAPEQWRAVLASRDPGFVPAIQAALAERAVAAAAASADTGQFMGQNGTPQNGSGEQRYGASPNGGQGSLSPYMGQSGGQSGGRDGETAPDHRRPSTAAALAARGQDGEADGSGSETRGLFA